MAYLHYSDDDKQAKERVLAALVSLGKNSDWQTVVELLLKPSLAQNDIAVRKLNHQDPDLPAIQGAARVLDDFLKLSTGARASLERIHSKSQTPPPGI